MTKRLSLWLILVVLAPIAQATEDTWPLEAKIRPVVHFSRRYGYQWCSRILQHRSIRCLKPHHFRWEIESPDRQLLVATPEAFWQWDKDLDVVILRDAPEIEDLPISAIWNGAVDDRSSSDVETGHFGDGVKNLFVGSPDENTIIVRFEDSLGQKILFEFSLEAQAVVTPAAFIVNVPVGVDFYDETSRSLGRSGATE